MSCVALGKLDDLLGHRVLLLTLHTLAEAHPGSVSGAAKIRQVSPLVASWSPRLLNGLHLQVLLGQHFFLNYEFECLLGKLASRFSLLQF